MTKVRALTPSRRDVVRLAAATTAAAPFVILPERTLAAQPVLRIAKWSHFLSAYDDWFVRELAAEWGRLHDIRVEVDLIPTEDVHAAATAEATAGNGHDVFMFPWSPAEFQKHAIDHAEIYQTVAFKYGNLDKLAHRSTFDPVAKKYFAFADFWIPAPFHYFEDQWREIGMPLGPIHYGSLRHGAKQIRDAFGIPCGLALAPSLEGNVTLHTLLYAFRSHVLDSAGNVTLGKTALTIEALKYAKALYDDAGTPDQLAWSSHGNVEAMLARKTSCTVNAISLSRAAEKMDPALGSKISLSPPLLGHAGVFAFPHVTNCSVVWSFARNRDGAKQFLADLIDSSTTSYEKSAGCNFPIYQKALPNLLVRLAEDQHADPPYKYTKLKDALYWTRNLGFPGYTNPAGMEVFNSFVIPRMFISVVTGRSSPEDAMRSAEAEVMRIADRWKQA
jgi:multiple sugar transport system substrate-binding protein